MATHDNTKDPLGLVARPATPSARATASLRWSVSPAPGGASLGLSGAF